MIVGSLPGYSRVVIGISHGWGYMWWGVMVVVVLEGRAAL